MQSKFSFTVEVKQESYDMFLTDSDAIFLQEKFLQGGSVTDPEKEYHLEITTDSMNEAEELKGKLKKFDIKAGIIEKKYKYVVYVKEAEDIALFLNLIGAHNALFKFEDAKVRHEMNNSINRVVNCETANISKIVNTAFKQIKAIEKIQREMGLEKLTDNLREVAVVRLENPDASLKEIGEMLRVPIGKSGVNHRLKRIEKIAEEL